jgi:sarcosine oxidase subunit gamma
MPFRPGRLGRSTGDAGLLVREYSDFALASVVARRGQQTAAATAAAQAFGIALPDRPRAVQGRDVTFIGSGPGQWTALAEAMNTGIENLVGAPLEGLASVFDQSDSRVLLELSGDKVREVLSKGVAIDLHPRAFESGDAALTPASHLAMQLWRSGDAPTFRALVPRAYFESFWHWLAASGAEYGIEVLEPRRYAARD